MAWRDQYHYKGYLYIPQMEVVYQSKIASFTYLSFQNVLRHIFGAAPYVIQGDINDVMPNMTVLVGSSPGLDDHGRSRVITTVPATHDLVLWTPIGIHDGELDPSADYYVTVLNDYRVWMKAPYAANGAYYYDGQIGPQFCTYEQYPMANGGPGVCSVYDDDTGVITVNFDAANSYAVADDAQLGGLTADLFGGAPTLTASEGTPANAIDGNTATYWAAPSATSNTGQYMHVDLGSGNDEAIRYMTVTASTNYGPDYMVFQYSDDDTNWITALYVVETSWTSHEEKTYDIHYTGAHRYWRLVVFNSTGGLPTYEPRIEEWELFGEDRTAGTSPYTWDVDDGSITVGSSTTEAITATFPEGFRWVTLTVTDTNGNDGQHYIPVGSVTYAHAAMLEVSYSGATITSSSEQGTDVDDNAFDNNTATKWTTSIGVASGWIQVQFASGQTIQQYGVDYTGISGGSYAHTIVVKGSNNGVDYDTLDTRTGLTWVAYQTFTIASPASYTYYKMEMTGSGIYVGCAEWDLKALSDVSATTGMISSAEVVSQSLEPMGQTFEFAIHEALPPYEFAQYVNVSEISYSGGTPVASSTNGANVAANAFDNNNGTYWEGTAPTAWLEMRLASEQEIVRYGVYASQGNGAPTSIIFRGWDGASYTTLDTQTGLSWSGSEEKTFDLDEPVTYLWYRLTINATDTGNARVYELNLYEGTPQYTPVYTDGNLVMYFEREWYDLVEGSLSAAGASGREHMRLVGWLDEEQYAINTDRGIVSQDLIIRCLDVGQRLNQLADFTFMAQKDAAPATGYEMKHANMDVDFYLMGRWLSTASELADFLWTNTADHFNIGLLAAQGSSIYDMINQRALGIDFMFTCNKMGQLKIVPDLRSCATEFRQNAATIETLTAADYAPLNYPYSRAARYHWVYGSGVGFFPHDADSGSFAVDARFTIAPGQVPGQGVNSDTEGERLIALSDLGDGTTAHQTTSIYERLGRSYAQKAAYRGSLAFELVHAGDTGLDPAEAQWVVITLPTTINTYRPRTLTAAQGIITRMDVSHDHEGGTKTITFEWEEALSNYVDAWAYYPT